MMPTIVQPIRPNGLFVPVLIGVDKSFIAAALAAGRLPAASAPALGQIDTGSNVSAVAEWVLRQLGLTSIRGGTTTTASGPVPVQIYTVSFGFAHTGQSGSGAAIDGNLDVLALPHPIPYVDVLIGMDVLSQLRFHLDGPAGTFALDF